MIDRENKRAVDARPRGRAAPTPHRDPAGRRGAGAAGRGRAAPAARSRVGRGYAARSLYFARRQTGHKDTTYLTVYHCILTYFTASL